MEYDPVEISNTIIKEIKQMMNNDGTIPYDVKSFSELHDYCDANVLGDTETLLELNLPFDEMAKELNKVQDIVDAYLKSVTFEMWVARNRGNQAQ